MTEQASPEDAAVARDHIARNRTALRQAFAATVRNCRGLLIGDVGVGLDHTVEDPTRRWWAKVTLAGGRAGREVIVEGYGSALEALEHLNPKVTATIRAARRGRR